jgi:uncharacterized membrane protein
MTVLRVLLAGESWMMSTTHYKGFDYMTTATYETGLAYLAQALDGSEIELTHIPSHLASQTFPQTLEALDAYDAVILSDIGAYSLLMHPDTWQRGQTSPNRLVLLREWVNQGGGLLMCGGYYSFAGIGAAAKFYRTPVEEVLPVDIMTFDDRIETPEGAQPVVVEPAHPILDGFEGEWPVLLGFNELALKPDARLLATVQGYPLLAARGYGRGRTLAWASDIGPHWCPEPFAQWEGYRRLWIQSIEWLAGQR